MTKLETKPRKKGGVTITVNGLFIFDCILTDDTPKIVDRRYTDHCMEKQKRSGVYYEWCVREAANNTLKIQASHPFW